jgi:hypothetical protein
MQTKFQKLIDIVCSLLMVKLSRIPNENTKNVYNIFLWTIFYYNIFWGGKALLWTDLQCTSNGIQINHTRLKIKLILYYFITYKFCRYSYNTHKKHVYENWVIYFSIIYYLISTVNRGGVAQGGVKLHLDIFTRFTRNPMKCCGLLKSIILYKTHNSLQDLQWLS